MTGLTRRRFVAISAAACVATQTSAAGRTVAAWEGQALGAHAQVAIRGLSQAEAAPVFRAIEAEVSRIEGVFSLYRADSDLARLNRDGVLHDPAPELLHLLSLARAVHSASEGAFDPTVQPLFALHAEAAARGRSASPDEVRQARSRIGFDLVAIRPAVIRFRRPGMGMTLNGIAQGYATDRIHALLSAEGLRDVLVNAGEIRTGGNEGAGGWPVTVPGGRTLRLRDRAIATSDVMGTLVDPAARIGHIFDPRATGGALQAGPVTVLHDTAAIADAVSTAAAVMHKRQLPLLMSLGAKILPFPPDEA